MTNPHDTAEPEGVTDPHRTTAEEAIRTGHDGSAGAGAAIQVTDLRRAYRSPGGAVITALDDVTLQIPAGAAVAVMGPSGSGKSTLLHLLGAMDILDHGNIHIDDLDLTTLTRAELVAYRRSIGFVFQRFLLLPALTATDNVAVPVLPYKTAFNKRDRARELLTAVGVGDRPDALPAELSGGQQQRVAIARALINHPRLLLADEPTGNLDTTTGTELMDLLLRLRAEHNMTLVIATHDPTVADRCDHTIHLRDGQVVPTEGAAT